MSIACRAFTAAVATLLAAGCGVPTATRGGPTYVLRGTWQYTATNVRSGDSTCSLSATLDLTNGSGVSTIAGTYPGRVTCNGAAGYRTTGTVSGGGSYADNRVFFDMSPDSAQMLGVSNAGRVNGSTMSGSVYRLVNGGAEGPAGAWNAVQICGSDPEAPRGVPPC
jgi:hypothetical protein